MSERFKKSHWRSRVRSSEGYEIRLPGRTGIDYRDRRHQFRIDAEAMSSPWVEVVVNFASIPDTPELPRSEVLDRLRRSFDFAGWVLTVNDAAVGPSA